jgi:hypothetical protein
MGKRRKRGSSYLNERHGRLVIIREAYRVGTTWYATAQCDCGSEARDYAVGMLVSGNTKSCGCLAREMTSARSKTHGKTKTTEYRSWTDMKQRVFNPERSCHHDYGGRGIDMDPRWAASFDAFLADMGLKPTPKHTIERNDNNRGYWPDNCRWATRAEQNRNSRKNRFVILNGEEVILAEADRRLGIREGYISSTAAEQKRTPQEVVDRFLSRRQAA